ncbi:unnamed protein product [Rotaria sordida]|uniref:Uncharacterized protein n=1 Tax=Rotaria sordida TaxID=392033 RepID=A0A814JPS7_9BILA|nr:unnamed protein product [Rotaria sordida]CAF1456344.1 unnamed protein product [Rotaria sordida]CAF3786709.1 unnamed protein product [Rotaria sordida]CAF4053851.1 unnamed protein product [Rotaria sordida]
MKPFPVHAQHSPTCAFVRSIIPDGIIPASPKINLLATTLTLTNDEQSSKRRKIDTTQAVCQSYTLTEVDILKQIRKRTFSHWPHRISPSSAQMIEAGLFSCNVGDRVICLYCNIICQQWVPFTDDPCEVHKILSPKCPYVIAMLKRQETSSIRIVNEQLTRGNSTETTNNVTFRSDEITYTAACHSNYTEIPRRHASFATWSMENLPSVDDLVKAGFFYTGSKTIVTCFYCGESLQNWGANDNPIIEHARWFPRCAYAKQLCGAGLHRKIQELKRVPQERANLNESARRLEGVDVSTGGGQLHILDENTLSKYIWARLDLPISQRLYQHGFKLSIISRCWKDQLRLKHDDFVELHDLFVACLILQKQIEHTDGKKENITIPSVAMKKIRERVQTENVAREQANQVQIRSRSYRKQIKGYNDNRLMDSYDFNISTCSLVITQIESQIQ